MRLPNFGYHVARWRGNLVRRFYRAFLPFIVRQRIRPARSVAIEVFAYSGEDSLPEQVASIRSFLRHVGRPMSFTIVSDGSHESNSLRWLRSVDPCVAVREPVTARADLPDRVQRYLNEHPTGKQLALIMDLPHSGPALYIDSDVLFFSGGADLITQFSVQNTSALYQRDCQFSGDRRLLRGAAEELLPVNTGFLLIFRKLDWSKGIARFLELEGAPNFFTNQTMTHLVMHDNQAEPFDPAKYVLQLDDQFIFPDRYAGPNLALRHYVNPVRHKFWTSLSQ